MKFKLEIEMGEMTRADVAQALTTAASRMVSYLTHPTEWDAQEGVVRKRDNVICGTWKFEKTP